MFTLLPAQNKRYLLRQYRFRLLSVILILAASVFAISVCLLLPSYFKLKFAKDTLTTEGDTLSLQIKEQNSKGLVQTLSDIKAMTSLGAPESSAIMIAITKVMSERPSRVSITSINYIKGVGAPSTLSFSGVAASRDDLITFSRNLGRQTMFTDVNLPVSNLAKETDAKFSLTVSGAF